MSTKRVLSIVLVASAVLLAVGIGPRVTNTARALPVAQQPGPADATIPYSGRLTDDAGQPVADGVYDFAFALYEAAEGGDPLWAETQTGVAVQGGAFTAALGSVSPLPDGAKEGDLWLEVEVRGPGEAEFTRLSPRQALSAAALLAPASPSAGPACAHDHLGENWVGAYYPGLRVEDTTIDGLGIAGFANTGTNAWGVYGRSTGGRGVVGSSANGIGVYGYSSSGAAIVAAGTGIISSTANSVLYLSPHDMVVRYPSTGVTLYPLDNGGVQIHSLASGIKYFSIPVPTFGTLYGARLYVKAIRVCYKAGVDTRLEATAVTKNSGADAGWTFYIFDTTFRDSQTYTCYTVNANTPRVPVDNSTWVQFNIRDSSIAANTDFYIYTVELTLTEQRN